MFAAGSVCCFLGVRTNTRSGRLCDKERKELIRIFNDFGLKITVQTNQQRTNFLDLTFDLTEGIYKPYRKPNDDPVYINRSSNHPPPIIRELPHSINRRINLLSSNKETFNEAAQTYNDALKRSDFKQPAEVRTPRKQQTLPDTTQTPTTPHNMV